jgi:4-hydroxy-4-methyl-2-oxoglutarate aldolase
VSGAGDTADLIGRLRALDTCAVSDALDRLGVKGAAPSLKPHAAAGTIAGRAVTVCLGPSAGTSAAGSASRHLGTAAVDASGPGDVIVVAHQGRLDCAGWGGLLSRAARLRGAEGVIVDGAARDLAEARAVGLPVHALAGTPVTARGRAAEHGWNEPVEICGVLVAPGDLALADEGGVVFIPAGHAREIIAAAERIAATEAVMAAALAAGMPVSQVMGRTYEELTTL